MKDRDTGTMWSGEDSGVGEERFYGRDPRGRDHRHSYSTVVSVSTDLHVTTVVQVSDL